MADAKEVYGSDAHLTLEDRINTVFDQLEALTSNVQTYQLRLAAAEENAMMDNMDLYMAAKNDAQRKAVVLDALQDDEKYHSDRAKLKVTENALVIANLKRDRIRYLIQACTQSPGGSL